MFESRWQPLATRRVFFTRVLNSFLATLAVIAISLGFGLGCILLSKRSVWAYQGREWKNGVEPEGDSADPNDVVSPEGKPNWFNYVVTYKGFCVYMDQGRGDGLPVGNPNPPPNKQHVIVCRAPTCQPKFPITLWCVNCATCKPKDELPTR